MKNPKSKFIFILGCFLLWLSGYFAFLHFMPSNSNCPTNIDSYLIFTGDSMRVENGIKNFSQSNATKLLISGVGMGVQRRDFIKILSRYQVDKHKIVLGEKARNTVENTKEAKIFLQLHSFKSTCLVTSDYHMMRSELLLEIESPNTKIYLSPIISEKTLSTLIKSFKEYNKYIATIVIHYIKIVDSANKAIFEKIFL